MPHRLVLATLAFATALAALLAAPHPALPSEPAPAATAAARPAPAAPWHWPVRARITGSFHLTPRTPYARGQRRGLDLLAAPGATVRAACPGRVTFAGPLPDAGLALTVRCGALAATYLHLAVLTAQRGDRVTRGARLGTLASDGRLRLGARHATDRHGYLDPLTLLRDPRTTAPPTLGPAPRPRARRRSPAPPTAGRPFAPTADPTAPRRLPWPAYPALALIATALPAGGLVHRRNRRAAATATAVHEGP